MATLAVLPIPMTMQTPFFDNGAPENPKQYGVLTIDANCNNQVLSPVLLFDDNNGTVLPVIPTPSTFTGSVRQKFQFTVNGGLGQQAYRISLKITGSVTAAPIIYQSDIYAMVLADYRTSWDSYWQKMSVDQSKIAKNIWFDITSTAAITVNVYADGNTVPYYSFSLAANPTRSEVPLRVRLPAQMFRMLRVVATSTAPFQLWRKIELDWKLVSQGSGWTRADLDSTSP